MYKIAEENRCVGHKINNIQVQINLGLKLGYEGFTNEKKEVLNFLTGLYKKALEEGKVFLPFVITDTVITYAWMSADGPVGAHEPALSLVSDMSPLYFHSSEEEWKELVEWYAAQLGEQFAQFRVYVTYTQVETLILQQA